MPAKAGAAALKGHDDEGTDFETPEQMWDAELAGGDEKGRAAWYNKGVKYWAAQPATLQTVMGGYAHVSPPDVRGSDAFLRLVLPAVAAPDDPRRPLVAADCGAGVGRVTQHVLLRLFDEVDLFEPVQHFLDTAQEKIGSAPEGPSGAPRAVTYTCQPLEEFEPAAGRYDVIWAQWCLGHLTDDDVVRFFRRCKVGLKRDGFVIIKDNNCESGFVVTKGESLVTRSNAYFHELFARAGLRVHTTRIQKNMPSELYPLRMYALVPE